MRSLFATTVVAVSLGAGSALAQSSEISLGWYEDNWEATTFPSGGGGWDCSVDSLADNHPDQGAWVFVFPTSLQFSPNGGLPQDGVGSVTVDNGAPLPMEIYQGQAGFLADHENLPLLQAMAQGEVMTIEVWSQSRPNDIVEYVYSLNGFREAFLRIASECRFDPAEVLDAGIAAQPTPQPEPSTGSSLFGRDKN